MKFKSSIVFLLLIFLSFSLSTICAQEQASSSSIQEGNIWFTEDSTKYFTCPVMKGEMKVSHAFAYSDIENVRYYHCCPPCQGPFRAETEKFLDELKLPANVSSVDEMGNKTFRDPISGKEFIHASAKDSLDVEGYRYYFHKKKNKKKFIAHSDL